MRVQTSPRKNDWSRSKVDRWVTIVIGAMMFLAAAVALGETKSLGRGDLVLNWKPEPQFGGFYQAELGGHFKDAGLEISVKPGGAGTPVVQMVASGAATFGIVSADEVIVSQERGTDVVALFAVYQTNPQAIMVRSERKIKNLAALFAADGTLALQSGLPYAQFLQKKYPKAKIKTVPYIGGIANFLADEKFAQQCFMTSEPIAATRAGKTPATFLVADEGYNPYTTVLVTRASTARANPAFVRGVVDAVRVGWTEYLQDPTSANAHMQKLNPSMDAETFRLSAEAQKSLIITPDTRKHGLGSMSEARWATLSQQLKDLGVVKTEKPAKDLFWFK